MISVHVFKGFSEDQLIETIQQRYFYVLPAVKEPVSKQTEGGVKVTTTSRQKIIEQPDSGIKIEITYNKKGKVLTKEIFLHSISVDRVDYVYKNNSRYSAISRLYGYHYFQPAAGMGEKLVRFKNSVFRIFK